MKTDIQGCSQCPAGTEQYEVYYSHITRKNKVQYDYRHTNGKLFSCIANSIEDARKMRDFWLIKGI